MNSGTYKPPLAPKPRRVQPWPSLSPSNLRKDSLNHPSPGVKPAIVPKPRLIKGTADVETKTLTAKSLHQTPVTETPRAVGLIHSQNGIQQENKKPDWDYIIAICLCSQDNCQCIRTPSGRDKGDKVEKVEKELKTFPPVKIDESRKISSAPGAEDNRGTTDTASSHVSVNLPLNACVQPESTITHLSNHEPLQEMLHLDESSSSGVIASSLGMNGTQWSAKDTWSDESDGTGTPRNPPGRKLAHPKPIPVPRKPRPSVPAKQEREEKKNDKVTSREGRDINVTESKLSWQGKESSSLSVSVPASENNRLIVEQAPTQTLSEDVEDLGLEDSSFDMELLVDGEFGEEVDKMSGEEDQEDVYSEVKHFPACLSSLDKLQLTQPLVLSVSAENRMVKVPHMETNEPPLVSTSAENGMVEVPEMEIKQPPAVSMSAETRMVKLPQMEIKQPPVVSMSAENGMVEVPPRRPLSHTTGYLAKGKVPIRSDSILSKMGMKELPLPPPDKSSRNKLTAGHSKHLRPSLGVKKSKSFSGADIIASAYDMQKKPSFRKLMDLKLSVMMSKAKGGKNTMSDTELSADNNRDVRQSPHALFRFERKLSCPLIGVEQSVDAEGFSPGFDESAYYENLGHYEEIPDYMNVHVGEAGTPSRISISHPAALHNDMYNDEGIYEDQEPYMSFEKHFGNQLCPTPTDRNSIDEEVVPLDNGHSDDDGDWDDDEFDSRTFSSDEEEEKYNSSMSSKGEAEHAEENAVHPVQKKSKIHHIAEEIMTSESVFVDVLKMLHIDFREVVSKSSRQNGKPVIEERILNQILYYLPQLYELNQDLLRELRERLANWDESSQLADVFLKKGPFLKMYSTYIREFDKNVALLVEQTKRNPAFGAIVREFEATPRCAGLALKHYLLKPIQRIPQYQLLLTDYLKNLPENSNDYKDTQAALALVKEVANHANDIIKQGDNFQKVMQVQCRLNGNHEIVQPGRIFLKEGALKKLSRKVMQPRMFFLFNDILLYTTPVQTGQYKLKNILNLAGMKVSKPSREACQNELNIESVERSFILSASSATERDEWLEAISTAIAEYTKKKISFIPGQTSHGETSDGTPLGSKAPIWIPDLRTTMCMICTSEFSLAWRRHHCRACGKVVCQACSANTHRLQYLKYQLARVCDQCFPVLQQQESKTDTSAVPTLGSKTFAFSRKQKKIPAALKAVTANTDSSFSGYLHLLKSKGVKKQGKRLWFVIKDKVLYMYAASEDVAALESQPLLGLGLREDSSTKLQFKLYHKNTLYYSFKADDVPTAQRWINAFKEATVL